MDIGVICIPCHSHKCCETFFFFCFILKTLKSEAKRTRNTRTPNTIDKNRFSSLSIAFIYLKIVYVLVVLLTFFSVFFSVCLLKDMRKIETEESSVFIRSS